MRTPTLTTTDLVLRPLYFATKENVAWLNDPLNVQFSEQRHYSHTLASQQKYIRGFDQINNHIWCIRRGQDNAAVGTITSHRDFHNQVADIGILIAHQFWKSGFGYQSWTTVIDWLFSDGIRKIESGTMATNHGMLAIFKRCGMILEGTISGHFIFNDQPVDMLLYGRIK